MNLKSLAKQILKIAPYPINASVLRMYESYSAHTVIQRLSKEQRELLQKINTASKTKSDSSKTKILFYHISGLSSGGTEKFLQIIAKHLDKSKFDVFFMYSPKPRSSSGGIQLDSRKSYLTEGAALIEFDYKEIEQTYPYFVVDQQPTIHEVIYKHDIDVICTAGSGYTEYPINTITNIPIVLINIFGSPTVQSNVKKHISISHTVDALIAPYIPAQKREVVYIQSEDPFKVYSNSQRDEMRQSLRSKLSIPQDAFVFGRIGRADDTIFDPIGINAFEQVVKKYPSAHYLIMSTPPILEKIVKERNIPNVHFLPPSGLESDVWSFHFAIDALAHFRLDGESFGLNIAESMIAGNPIVTHKSHIWNAHLEYLDPSFSFVVEKDDANAYAQAMEKLIAQASESEADIKVMQDKAREQAEKLFLIDKSINKIEEILNVSKSDKYKSSKIKISILQKPGAFIFKGCIRYYAKKIIRGVLGIQRGPDVVLRSLIRGLKLTNVEFNVNPNSRHTHRIVHVTSNPVALTWAIKQKKLGKIDKLIAGPNISILPTDDKSVLLDPSIDIVLVPSEWIKEGFSQCSATLKHKLRVWPSGVEIPDRPDNTNGAQEQNFIIFKKEFSDEKFEAIKTKLNLAKIKYTVLEYGKFKQRDYFKLLESASGMIYLQKAESQGVALQEAWARNVPTLVWDSKTYTYSNNSNNSNTSNVTGTNITVSGKVSAPYLTEQSGLFFDSVEDFDGKFKEFSDRIKNRQFSARAYCIERLSDKASVDMYLDYISKI